MKKIFRFSMVAVIVALTTLVASGVWASPRFAGTVPPPPPNGGGAGGIEQMGTANIETICDGCRSRINNVQPSQQVAPPTGLIFYGDVFSVAIDDNGVGTVLISFAFPPAYVGHSVTIYKLNTSVNPNVWEAVTGAVIANGTISVVGGPGIYSLIGTP